MCVCVCACVHACVWTIHHSSARYVWCNCSHWIYVCYVVLCIVAPFSLMFNIQHRFNRLFSGQLHLCMGNTLESLFVCFFFAVYFCFFPLFLSFHSHVSTFIFTCECCCYFSRFENSRLCAKLKQNNKSFFSLSLFSLALPVCSVPFLWKLFQHFYMPAAIVH